MKIISWNVNGLRAVINKGFMQILEDLDPDFICLQEIKMMPEQMPERLESGTLNTPAIAGLKAGIDYINEVGIDAIARHEQQMVDLLVNGIRSVQGTTVYGPAGTPQHGGAVSFSCQNRDSAEIGFLLDQEYDIMVRVGLHCAPGAHRMIGTYPQGTVRVSPGYFTTAEQIESFVQAIANIVRK